MASRPTKRRRLTPPQSDGESPVEAQGSSIQQVFFRNAANWDLEQKYESKPRTSKTKGSDNGRLPIKTTDGILREAAAVREDSVSPTSENDWSEDDETAASPLGADVHLQEEPQIPEKQQILDAKEELAKIALKLSEDPEGNPGAFKALARVGQSRITSIKKLCLVTQMAIYKDVIPGYRIRPVSGEGKGEKLSKEVRRVRAYEQALVSGYQAYVRELAKLAKGHVSTPGDPWSSLDAVAITCACTLLNSVPHFNFREELLRILVGKLSKRQPDESFIKCRKALETLFREDEEGRPSMEAVSLLAKMMRAREFRIDESVLNVFLHLRLLSEFPGTASKDQTDQDNGVIPRKKASKAQREVRSKRERKLLKEQRALEKDMVQADALVSHEEKDHMQSETLKLVFATYFRILKMRLPHLMGAVLEGLAKYAHLINQDFFGDLLEALKDLIRHSDDDRSGDDPSEEGEEDEVALAMSRNPSREALLCTVTAFALLAGQDAHNARATLHLDLSFFATHLFRSIFALSLNPDVELGARSLHLPDPDDPIARGSKDNRVNFQTTTVLLVKCLTAILLPPYNIRSVPPLRLAAFTKQLMSAALHLPEKSSQAVLVLLTDVSHSHGKKISALWNTEERKGDGTYNPLSETVEGCNPFTTTVWEGELLKKHFSPKVRDGVKTLQNKLSS